MTLKTTQLAALQQAIVLLKDFRASLPPVRSFVDAADALTSAQAIGNARAEITTALAFGDPARASLEFENAGAAFRELNQLAQQVPQICASLNELKSAWDALYPALEVPEPVTFNFD